MDHFVTHIIEPQRLLLRWQSNLARRPEDRTHWIVGELTLEGAEIGKQYRLRYCRGSHEFEEAQTRGFEGHIAYPNLDEEYAIRSLDAFMTRLPPRSRGDFGEYLAFHCLPSDAVISDFALLGYTGAKLPSDGFSFIHPFDDTDGPCEFRMDVAGWRHYPDELARLQVGLLASFAPEPANIHDLSAVQVLVKGNLVGYVPRGLTDSFHRWARSSDVSAVIHSVPLPEERPELALFVTVARRER